MQICARCAVVSSPNRPSIKVLLVQGPMWHLSVYSRPGQEQEQERSPAFLSCLSRRWANGPFFTPRAKMMSSSLWWPKWQSSANNSPLLPPVWSLRQQLISSHALLTSTNNIPPAFPLPLNDLPTIFISFSLRYELTGVVFRSAEVIAGGWTIHQRQQKPAPLLH